MKTLVLILSSVAGLALAAPGGHSLPPGMVRADDPKAVAALLSTPVKRQADASERESSEKERLTAADEYHLKLVAYRTRLVEEQRQRKIKELELLLEREARIRAEEAAARERRERRRESIFIQHHSVHAYQRNLNDEYVREQRLRKLIEQQCSKPCPTPTPCPAPSPDPAPASGGEAVSGDILP